MILQTGTLVDEKYEIISLLGEGGMSMVYKARQKQLDRLVAIKLLKQPVHASTAEQARLQREALALSTLAHRNIVAFYGFGIWRGSAYIVMEYIDGPTLESMVSPNSPMEPTRAISIVAQLCDALTCAHNHGIIHRDLKPLNIVLVKQNGVELPKIIDFGLTCLLSSLSPKAQKLTETGLAVGSLLYMSPEQCTGSQVDGRSDIYALGAVLHFSLTGSPPFCPQEAATAMTAHLRETPPALDKIVPNTNFPAGLQGVIYRAMAKSPDDRYASAENMQTDLQQVINGKGQSIDAHFRGASRQPQGRRLSARVGVAVLASAAMLAAIVLIQLSKNDVKNRQSESTDSSTNLYEQACILPDRPATAAKVRNLLDQALRHNETDKSLTGFRLCDAYYRKAVACRDLNDRAAAQDTVVSMLKNSWFSNLPITNRARAYRLASTLFSGCLRDHESGCSDFKQKMAAVRSQIEQELSTCRPNSLADGEVPSLVVSLGQLEPDSASLNNLTTLIESQYLNKANGCDALVELAHDYTYLPLSTESRRSASRLCSIAEKHMNFITASRADIRAKLCDIYQWLGEYELGYQGLQKFCRENASPAKDVLKARMACFLEDLDKHDEALPVLSQAQQAKNFLDKAGREAIDGDTRLFCALAAAKGKTAESQELLRKYGL